MSLQLDPDTRVHTIWFVGWGEGDFMAYVFKPPGQPWIGEYRFRYHTAPKTGDPFKEKDQKSFHTYQNRNAEDGPENLVKAMEMIVKMTALNYNADLFDTLEINGSGLDAMRELEKQDWCFMKQISPEEMTHDVDGRN